MRISPPKSKIMPGRICKPISLSFKPEYHSRIKAVSDKKTGGNLSEWVRKAIDRQLVVEEEGMTSVVLKIPKHILETQETLRRWLDVKVTAIVKAFFHNET
jgi:hypothetical protein